MEQFIIRQAKLTDIAALEDMYRRRVLFNNEHDIAQWHLHEVTWEALSELYTIEDCYVGEVNGTIACACFIVDIDELYWPECKAKESLYLHKICVDPNFRGKGYSDALITFFKEKGRQEGYPCVRLDVRKHKKALRDMYERNGFTLVKYGDFVPEFSTALYHYVF